MIRSSGFIVGIYHAAHGPPMGSYPRIRFPNLRKADNGGVCPNATRSQNGHSLVIRMHLNPWAAFA
jgi:hypothetical protein